MASWYVLICFGTVCMAFGLMGVAYVAIHCYFRERLRFIEQMSALSLEADQPNNHPK